MMDPRKRYGSIEDAVDLAATHSLTVVAPIGAATVRERVREW
jgi:hypothetical protein